MSEQNTVNNDTTLSQENAMLRNKVPQDEVILFSS